MKKHYAQTIFGLSIAGLLFSGYLSFYKLLTGQCALGETCPFFLGHPACWYGFALFVLLTAFSTRALLTGSTTCRYSLGIASFVGTVFSGSFIVPDVTTWLASGKSYGLILPSCVYGFVVFLTIFVLVIVEAATSQEPVQSK
ncbi:MAG TPA: hypothetical protein VF803_00090 [Candidatus Paceibacterota bacterium]